MVISIDNSAVNSGDTTKSVEIQYPISGETNTIKITNGSISGADKVKRVETGVGQFYKVESQYGENGLINKITVTK